MVYQGACQLTMTQGVACGKNQDRNVLVPRAMPPFAMQARQVALWHAMATAEQTWLQHTNQLGAVQQQSFTAVLLSLPILGTETCRFRIFKIMGL